MTARLNLVGQTFSKLSVITKAGVDKRFRTKFRCKCECGNEIIALGSALKSRNVRSCGCVKREKLRQRNLVHGQSYRGKTTPEWRAFHEAKRRCNDPNRPNFADYGGRGIKFLFKSFNEFFTELGPKPSKNLSLDRIDNNGHYEFGNVRWATRSEQNKNRRFSQVLRDRMLGNKLFLGKKHSMATKNKMSKSAVQIWDARINRARR